MLDYPFSALRAIFYLIIIDQLRCDVFSARRTTVCPMLLHDASRSLMRSIICNFFLQILCLCIYDFLHCRLCFLLQTQLYPDGEYLNIIDYCVQHVPVFNISLHRYSSCPSQIFNLSCPADTSLRF